jgi:hypothetical protein
VREGAHERGEATGLGEASASAASPLCFFVGDGEGVVEMLLADGCRLASPWTERFG